MTETLTLHRKSPGVQTASCLCWQKSLDLVWISRDCLDNLWPLRPRVAWKLPCGKHTTRCGKPCGKPQGFPFGKSSTFMVGWWLGLSQNGGIWPKFMAGHLRPCQFVFFHGEKSCVPHGNLMQFGLPNFETTPSHYPMNYISTVSWQWEFLTSENHPWIDRNSKNLLAIFNSSLLKTAHRNSMK